MNELLGYLGMVRDAGWLYLVALLAFATGLFLFDRRADATAAESEESSTERRAA